MQKSQKRVHSLNSDFEPKVQKRSSFLKEIFVLPIFRSIRKATALVIALSPICCGAQDIEVRKQNVAIPHGSLASGLANTFLPTSELSSPSDGFVSVRNKSATINLSLSGVQLSGSGA